MSSTLLGELGYDVNYRRKEPFLILIDFQGNRLQPLQGTTEFLTYIKAFLEWKYATLESTFPVLCITRGTG